MSKLFDEKQSRREFLTSVARYTMLGGLIGGTGTLVAKRIMTPEEERVELDLCQSCNVYEKCNIRGFCNNESVF